MLFFPESLLGLLAWILHLLSLLIVADVIVSWAWVAGMRWASPYQPWVRTLRRITEPILVPIRAMIPGRILPGIDISPMIAILLLQFLGGVLSSLG